MDNNGEWRILKPIQRPKERHSNSHEINVPIQIGSSLWIASNEQLIEYQLQSDSCSMGSMIPYPALFRFATSMWVKSCKHKDDSIVLFNKRGIVVFDTTTRTFNEVTPIFHHFGWTVRWDSSFVCIGDSIHIMNGLHSGLQNPEGRYEYHIYSMEDQRVNTFKELLHFTMGRVPILKQGSYKSSDKMLISGFARKQTGRNIPSVIVDLVSKFSILELFQFGGLIGPFSYAPIVRANDSFYVGSLANDGSANGAERIQWKLAPEYKLKYPLSHFGYIQCGPFVVTFGGVSDERFRDGANRNTDGIYILDLRKNSGWIESPIKCPKKIQFHAVLGEDRRVHLLSRYGSSGSQRKWFRSKEVWEHEHYCIDLTDVIPELLNK